MAKQAKKERKEGKRQRGECEKNKCREEKLQKPQPSCEICASEMSESQSRTMLAAWAARQSSALAWGKSKCCCCFCSCCWLVGFMRLRRVS